MRDPRQLEVADLALNLADITYRVTRGFPSDERFSLVAQMRRAAVSVGSNIAEGCGRSTDRAFVNYIDMALGSLLELDFQAQVAIRLGHGNPDMVRELRAATGQLRRMLASLSASVRRKTPVAASRGQ
ncbi:MAG TPA: four helix bundle protein [Gemmatimonadaceae bacterium]|nr:four helix bundle protein [Gemmatimonadaceae bacterium]